MATQKDTVEYILETLDDTLAFSARPMFGEYALYAHGKVVALICDDTLFVKIMTASQQLESLCEKGPPYPGAKPYYVIAEEQLNSISHLSQILLNLAEEIPAKKTVTKKI